MSADGSVDRLRSVLQETDLRIELSFAFTMREPGVQPCAQLYVKNASGRWVKADGLPLILPPEGQSRADLLRLFADLTAKSEAAAS